MKKSPHLRGNLADYWFRSGRRQRPVHLRLFCFPYAGGTAAVYKDWADHLPATVQVLAVELPGRGSRIKEAPFVSIPALIDALVGAIVPFLDVPFAFFGHSMGAVIAFELARRLRKTYRHEPEILLVSGRRAPQIPDIKRAAYDLPTAELIEELRRLDGTPKEVLENTELMELIIPLLRADFQMIQTYTYEGDSPLRCPISAYGGLRDHEETREQLLLWREQTISRFCLHMLPGDHFFVRSAASILLATLSRELESITARELKV